MLLNLQVVPHRLYTIQKDFLQVQDNVLLLLHGVVAWLLARPILLLIRLFKVFVRLPIREHMRGRMLILLVLVLPLLVVVILTSLVDLAPHQLLLLDCVNRLVQVVISLFPTLQTAAQIFYLPLPYAVRSV